MGCVKPGLGKLILGTGFTCAALNSQAVTPVSYYQFPAGATGSTYVTGIVYTNDTSHQSAPPTGLDYWPSANGRIVLHLEHSLINGGGPACLHTGTENNVVLGIQGTSVDTSLVDMVVKAQEKHIPVSIQISNYCEVQTLMLLPKKNNNNRGEGS